MRQDISVTACLAVYRLCLSKPCAVSLTIDLLDNSSWICYRDTLVQCEAIIAAEALFRRSNVGWYNRTTRRKGIVFLLRSSGWDSLLSFSFAWDRATQLLVKKRNDRKILGKELKDRLSRTYG
jgi:hypothetical protein